MMRFLILIFTILALQARGQYFPDGKRDYNWVYARSENIGTLGTIAINFSSGAPVVSYPQAQLDIIAASSIISGKDGKLCFYSNGFKVADRYGNIMPHGDSLSFCYWYTLTQHNFIWQSTIALPDPANQGLYYLVHGVPTTFDSVTSVVKKLLYSKIDMSLNDSLGDVIEKNSIIIDDTLDVGGIDACRHANGRDWWIIAPEAYYDCYYLLLLDPSGLHIHHKKCFSELRIRDYILGTSIRFSPDGEHLIRCSVRYTGYPMHVELFGFDRCFGSISKIDDLYIPGYGGIAWTEFAPGGDLVYYTRDLYVYQGDVTAPDFSQSMVIIDTAEYYTDTLSPIISHMIFYHCLIGPDGKIYISAGPANYFSVIEDPDMPGQACNVQQHSLNFSKFVTGEMPNIPNFRLGPLTGSVCDTIPWTGIGEDLINGQFNIKVNGNPVSSEARFEINGPFSGQDMELAIYNVMGQELQTFNIAPFQSILNMDVSGINNGLYLSILRKNGKKLGEARFVVAK